jgi:hypothetical protein
MGKLEGRQISVLVARRGRRFRTYMAMASLDRQALLTKSIGDRPDERAILGG